MLDDGCYLALRPEWILRNDDRQVIVYLLSNYEARYQVLDPAAALVASFLDGRHTVAELAEILRYVGGLSSADAGRLLLDRVVELLNAEVEKVAVLDKPASWQIDYRPLDFIISPRDFVFTHRLSRPLSLMLYFSAWCQTNCRYCYADLTGMRRLKHLSLAQWLPILRDARDLGIRMIQLTGGDPMGRPDSVNFVAHLIDMNFLFMISTKCYVSLVDAEQLVDAGFNETVSGVSRDFQVSIDSVDSTVVDYLMRSRGYLERATETVRNLLRAGIVPRVKAVLTPLNYRTVREHVDTFAALGIEHFQFSTYARSNYRHNDQLFMSDEMKAQTAQLLNAVQEDHPELTIEGDARKFVPMSDDQHQKERRWADRTGCSAGRTNLGVAPDGHAVLCEQMPLSESYFVGDLTKQSILEVWNSRELLEFIFPTHERFVGTPCYGCSQFEYCINELGYCFRDSFFGYGRVHHPPPNCPRAPAGARPLI
jgi:radical SAM protein with 4Fe4S-binding SPASM domain